MGEYINPHDRTKEEFLVSEGRLIGSPQEALVGEELPVCLVNNGPFTAAGIAYDAGEIAAFTEPGDSRPKKWYAVSIKKLKPFMSLYLLKQYGDA